MAKIEIAPLAERLEDEEIATLQGMLRSRGIARLPQSAGAPTTLGSRIDDEALQEFLDLLVTHEAACDIYLPVEFSGQVEIGDLRVGATTVLMSALEELRGDLDIADDEEEEDDLDPDEMEHKLRGLWRLFQQGAEVAMQKRLPLHVHP